MKIKGVKSEEVTVDVDSIDMIMALASIIYVEGLFTDVRDSYEKIENKDNKHYFVRFENISYHGSSNYKEVRRTELSDEEWLAAEGLKALMNIIQRKK